MTPKQTNIKCKRCGYGWNTDSKMKRVSCPSCGYSTPNPNYKVVSKE